MIIKKAYYYLFYKFYKFSKLTPTIFPHDWTAAVAIAIIETYCFGELKIYYKIFIDRTDNFKLSSIDTIIPLAGIVALNYLLFINDNKWQIYVHEFDKLPKRKNIIGSWVVITILAILFVSVVISFNLIWEIKEKK